ncbi:MAG: phosphoenolpyruvate carboxykinase (ATP), partial [Bacteroidota bacterium]
MDTIQNVGNQNLKQYGLEPGAIHWNLSPKELTEETLRERMGELTNNGTLVIKTGKFTGRSPQDRFIVKDDYTKDKVWW